MCRQTVKKCAGSRSRVANGECLQVCGRVIKVVVLNGAARRSTQRRIGKPGPASTSKSAFSKRCSESAARFGRGGEAGIARIGVLAGWEAWPDRFAGWRGRAKEWLRTAADVPFEGAGAKSLGLATLPYTSATRLTPPVFDPCRSGLAPSVTIISQLRSKATKQLIPPQHPIDAFYSLGEPMGFASPSLPDPFCTSAGAPSAALWSYRPHRPNNFLQPDALVRQSTAI
jgi:hypothetical protein